MFPFAASISANECFKLSQSAHGIHSGRNAVACAGLNSYCDATRFEQPVPFILKCSSGIFPIETDGCTTTIISTFEANFSAQFQHISIYIPTPAAI